MTLEITKEEAEQILNYLAGRPFIEVHKLIPILTNLKPIAEELTADAE